VTSVWSVIVGLPLGLAQPNFVTNPATLQAELTDRLSAELTEARKGWLERLLEAIRRR
jgi:hypothetical protein